MARTRGTAGKEKDDAAGKEKEDVATDSKSPPEVPNWAQRKKSTRKAKRKSQLLPTAANAHASAPQPKNLRKKQQKTAEGEPPKKKTKITVRHEMYEDPPLDRFLHNQSVELEEMVAKCSTRSATSNEDDTTKSVSKAVSPKKILPIPSKSCNTNSTTQFLTKTLITSYEHGRLVGNCGVECSAYEAHCSTLQLFLESLTHIGDPSTVSIAKHLLSQWPSVDSYFPGVFVAKPELTLALSQNSEPDSKPVSKPVPKTAVSVSKSVTFYTTSAVSPQLADYGDVFDSEIPLNCEKVHRLPYR